MKHTMFYHLFTILVIISLILTAAMSGFFYFTLRNSLIEQRLNQLHREAVELSYMAEKMYNPRYQLLRPILEPDTEEMVMWKLSSIYHEYNAYSLLLSSDRQSILYQTPAMNDADVVAYMDTERINQYLIRVLQGETVTEQTRTANGPLFTVAVPWMINDLVKGGVFIQTTAQTIRSLYTRLIWQVGSLMLLVLTFSLIAAYFLAKHLTKPLTGIAEAAEELKKGNFDVSAEVSGSIEVCELAETFNSMAEQLRSTEKTRRDFVANVSHELRSPVTNIQGYAQGMIDGTIPENEHPGCLRIIADETNRMAKLVGNLLNLSRMDAKDTALSYSDFDINEMIRRIIISRLDQMENRHLEPETRFEEEKCSVHADADQIYQVILNLLDNAVKYTPDGGNICISTFSSGEICCVRVKDNGNGILPQDRPYIFDRFYKADKAHTVGKGTGLGLAICKKIMTKHGQDIRLLDTEEGAEFEFTVEKSKGSNGGSYADQSLRENQLGT